MTTLHELTIGHAMLRPCITGDALISLGEIVVGGTSLRNPATRFLPWFDSYEGDIFRAFRVRDIGTRDGRLVFSLRVVSDPDVMFRERRDSSGDICFRAQSWDAPPVEGDFRILFEPAAAEVDGRAFTGFKYWFEYAGATPIHRLIDRQTWEIGGNLDDVTICLRNWLTPPRLRITRETTYSTVGLDKWASLLPGNLWGRWSLLPSFDMQYGAAGILLGWFDEVSNIRTVVESNAGEEALRVQDMHLFAQATAVKTNPKTILYSPDRLDDVDALNLWTRLQDREHDRACRQFGIRPQGAPPVVFSENVWHGMRFDTTYEHVLEVADEFGADYVFIDPVWEHMQAYKETLEALIPPEKQQEPILHKFEHHNMCVTLDFEVANIMGGEAGLKALCDRARAQGLNVISWMATHFLHTTVQLPREHEGGWLFAAKESGHHPDTGYAPACWTLNLNTPILEKIRAQLLGVCQRTGLAGFLWDSFSNLGWWQLNYSDGSMRPQFDHMAGLFADLTNAGLYLQPEGIVTFPTLLLRAARRQCLR